MEAGVDLKEEPDRFAPAIDVATRLLDNIETVVYGKREEVKLVLAALMCGGHVLLEDVPGTAKTVLARARTVFAVPGTSSSRTWPSQTSAASTSRTSSVLP